MAIAQYVVTMFITPVYNNACSGSLNPMSFYRVWSSSPGGPILVRLVPRTVRLKVTATPRLHDLVPPTYWKGHSPPYLHLYSHMSQIILNGGFLYATWMILVKTRI